MCSQPRDSMVYGDGIVPASCDEFLRLKVCLKEKIARPDRERVWTTLVYPDFNTTH